MGFTTSTFQWTFRLLLTMVAYITPLITNIYVETTFKINDLNYV